MGSQSFTLSANPFRLSGTFPKEGLRRVPSFSEFTISSFLIAI